MKVLVIGSGGREHAICWAFSKSPKVSKLFCANGNAGIAEIAECVPIKPEDISGLVEFASQNAIDLTFVGGEVSLALGVVDEFETRGLKIIGPNRRAAQLESSKSFAKNFMARHDVPTAKYTVSNSPESAILELESGAFGDESTPVVVKADGLAAGKGVVVAANRAEAVAAIKDLQNLVGADASEKIVLEECLVGKEVSLLMFANGEDFALMPPVRDHKRVGEGDTGPNTGGMGTFTDASLLTEIQIHAITETMIRPTLRGCINEGFPFRGILFLGLMMTANCPMLLEYNVRFGDPETQAILVRLETDLVDICEAMCTSPRVSKGDTHNVESIALPNARACASLADLRIHWKLGNSACVVLASKRYPGKPQTGDTIHGLDEAKAIPNVEVFHAGTASDPDGAFVTSGGRVMGVTSIGDDLNDALSSAYKVVEKVNFDGMQYRRDIGNNALK